MPKTPVKTQKLIRIAVPCFIEQLLVSLISIASAMMVGQLGKAELNAANMSGTIVNWLQCVYTGLAAGSTIVIGRMWGAGDKEGVKSTFVDSLIVNTGLSVLLMLLLIVFQQQITELFFGGADAEVKEKMDVFFKFCMISMPAMAIANIICACLRGIGDNKTCVYCNALINVIYLVMAYPLIYGVPALGIPRYGIFGAGVATLAARYLGTVITIIYVVVKHKPIVPDRKSIKMDTGILKRVVNVGIPSAAEQFIFNGGFVILQSVLISFGMVFQAGYQIGANLNSIMCVPSNAIGVAITAMTSQALGRRDKHDAMENVKAARFLYVIIFSMLGAIVFMMSEPLVRLYTSDAEVIKEGVYFIRVFAVESLAIGYFQSMAGVLRGAGDIKYILVSSTVALWFCRIGLTWGFSKIIDPHIALLVGLSADFYLRAFMYHFRVQKRNWLEIVV